jgi:beta-glucosidase
MTEFRFPKDFLWGVAISGHQTEGNNVNADWYLWEKQGKIEDGSVSGQACDFYRCYQQDIGLAKNLNLNAFRLGIEWSRIEPKRGEWDEKEIEHYRQVLLFLKKNNFKVFLTIWHFTLPQWFVQEGGWEDKRSIKYFCRFVEKIVGNFSSLVDFWLVFNEPTMYTGGAYLTAIWPPQKKSIKKSIKVFFNLVKAYKKSYRIIHQVKSQAKVGLAQNVVYFYSPQNPIDKQLSWAFNFLYNKSFHYFTKRFHDFIGLNYYYAYRVTNFRVAKKIRRIMVKSLRKKDLTVEIYPPGIYQVTKMFKKYKLPIYITENGLDDSSDDRREDFIKEHLKWLAKAIENKVPIEGYFHWSLIDNFEWQEGFEPKYGLFAVNYKTQERKMRPSSRFYEKIAKEGKL